MTPLDPEGLPAPAGGDMPPEAFRRHAHDVVEWMADYLVHVDDLPVLAQVEPGEVRGTLPGRAPEEGEPMEAILADFREKILPGMTHWNHPSFHAWIAVTASGPGILGEMISAALNVNAMVWRSSPAGTELEELTLDWLREMLGLPDAFRGTIQDTASSSSLVALAAARERAYPEAREGGLAGVRRGRIYASEEAHSSIAKAGITLGLGRDGTRTIPTDDAFRMDPAALREAVEEDLRAGVRPMAVVATLGTTSTTSMDPVAALADIAAEHGMWLHVDAAYAGAAAVCPELRPGFEGWERADSIVVNPHKWLFTPIDCSALLVRDPAAVRDAFSLVPEYLRTAEEEVATNLMDYGVALGRRFRALKLWFVLRWFGREGVARRIREHIAMAHWLAERIDETPGWERAAPAPFSIVCFRRTPAGAGPEEQDRLSEAVLERVNASGRAFLSHTRLRGRYCLRVAIGNLKTTREHVERLWELLNVAAAEVE